MTRSSSRAIDELRAAIQGESGSVLASVLIVSVSLFILASSMLFFMVSRYSVHQRLHNRTTARYLAESALNRLISTTSPDSLLGASDNEQAPNGGSLAYETYAWGPHLLVRASGRFANQSVILWAVVGSRPDALLDGAIVTADSRFPIVAAGDTRITGDIYTGPLGLQAGQIRGEAPVRESFHNGEVLIRRSIPEPPDASASLGQYVADISNRRQLSGIMRSGTSIIRDSESQILDEDSLFYFENNLRLENVSYSSNRRLSLFVGGFVEITGDSKLSGPIEIVAEGPIYVNDSTTLDGTLLYSQDSIVVQDYAVVLGTAVSRTSVYFRDHSTAFYPATIYVEGNENTPGDSVLIHLTGTGAIEAVCVAAKATLPRDTIAACIYVDTGVTFRGYLLSQNRVDERGTVQGAIYTSLFAYRYSPTTYVNWLKDAKIYRQLLDFNPALPLNLETDSVQLAILRVFGS